MSINSNTPFYDSIRKQIEKEMELDRREKEVSEKEKRIDEATRSERRKQEKKDVVFSEFEKTIKLSIEQTDNS